MSVEAYLSGLAPDRREALGAVRAAILKNLPAGFEEGPQYGMIGYYVPHRVYAAGYHCDPKQPLPLASLGSQKNHMALYLTFVYSDPDLDEWFRAAYAASGKKLDMGKGCLRFKKLDDLPLDVVGQLFARASVEKCVAINDKARADAQARRKKG